MLAIAFALLLASAPTAAEQAQKHLPAGDNANCEVAIDMDVDGFFALLNKTLAMYK